MQTRVTVTAAALVDRLLRSQNPDGGWGYTNRTSWTEPTALAVLALDAAGAAAAATSGRAWLRTAQRSDGGWGPNPEVPVSAGVSGLAALAADLPGASRQAAFSWVLAQATPEMDWVARLRFRLQGMPESETIAGGYPWFPGTAAWVIPTSYAALFLSSIKGIPESQSALVRAQRYLLSRACEDGGWNHGGSRLRSPGASSYPETTGIALLALTGVREAQLQRGVEAARTHGNNPQSAEGAALIHMALHAHDLAATQFEPALPLRRVTDCAWTLLALCADSNSNKLIHCT